MAISTPTNNSNVGLAGSTTTYAVTGTCSENGRVVSLNVNGSSATGWTSPNCSGGGFSGTFNMASYSDGTLNLVARQSDLASNTGSSSSIALTKDTIAPTLALVTPANKSFINQSSDSAKFVVEGTCSENGATIRVLVNDTELAITDCQSGAYSTSVDTLDLMEAEHSFVAKAEDASGNISSSATHAVTKDMTPPTLSMVQPANSSFINIASNTTAFPVSGACSETGRSVSVLVNGSAAAGFAGGLCSGGLWSATVNVSGLADKPHTFAAELTDEAGNTTTTSDSNVTKDTSAPVVAVTTPSTNLGYVNLSTRGSVTISGSCSENSRVVRVELNSSGGGSAIIVNPTCTSNTWTTSQSFVGFGDGIVTASVSHVDAAGNSSSATRTWTLDATRPTVTLNQASWQRDTTVANWGFYELVFSENISGLTASDFVYPGTATIALGSLNLETTTPNTEFLAQVVVNASATGRMELQLPAGVVTDAAGNTNLAATSTDNAVTKVSEISSWQWLDTTSATEGINADTTTPAQDLFTFQSDGYSTLYATWMEEGDLKIRQLNGNYFSQPSWKAISTPQLPVAALNLESVGSDPEGTMVGMAYRSDDNNLWAIDIDLSGPSISYDFTHGTAKGGTPVTSFIMKYLNGGDTEIAVAGLRLDAEVSKLNLYSDFGSSTLEVESIYSNPPGTYAAFSGLAGALSQVTTTPYYLVAQGTRSADTDKNGNVSYLESNSVILYARTTVISDLIKDPYAVTGNTALTSNTTGSWVYGAWIERNASGKDIVHVVAHEVGKAPIFELTSTGLNKNLSYSAKDVSVAWVNNKLYAAWSELNASGFWQLRIAVWNGSTSSPAWSFIDGNSATLGANKSTSHSFSNVRLSVWADRLVVSGLQTDSSGVAQALIAIGW
jgi:hypothetical protein